MNLGLNQLSDDQVLELLQEILAEFGSRAHYVRHLAEELVLTEAEKAKAARDACERARAKALADFRERIYRDILPEVEAAMTEGRWAPMDADEESAYIPEATRRAVAEIEARLNAGSPHGFVLSNSNGQLKIQMGDIQIQSRRVWRDPSRVQRFCDQLLQILCS